MRVLIVALVLVTAGLQYLAVNPTPVAKVLYQLEHGKQNLEQPIDNYDELVEGAAAENPYYQLELGLFHRMGAEWLPEGVEADPQYGEELIEAAMEAGYARAGVFWYWFIDKTRSGLERAAKAGAPAAVEQFAVATALEYCEAGSLPPEAMPDLLAQYEEAMSPERYLAYVPEEFHDRHEEFQPQREKVRDNVLNKIPEHFDELCSSDLSQMLPAN